MRPSRLVAWLAVLVSAGCGGSPGAGASGPAGGDPLDVDWLDGASTISAAHLARVLALGARDPVVVALEAEARARLGAGTLEGLAASFSVCPEGGWIDGGLTNVRSADAWIPRSLEDAALGRRPARTEQDLAERLRGPHRDQRVTTQPDFLLVESTLPPSICVRARLPLVAAYAAVVHELVHALRLDPRQARKLALTAPDEASFAAALVRVPGGEVDAYALSVRARARLPYRGRWRSGLDALTDPRSGELRLSLAALGDFILAPRPLGLGYADGLLRGGLAKARRELRDELTTRRELLARMLADRRENQDLLAKNVEIHAHNGEVHRKNLELALARHDGQVAARSRAGIEEASRLGAEARALLSEAGASEARLAADAGTIDAELSTLDATQVAP